MKSYGQFCSIARALDLLGERWTLLVVRELLCGSRTFGDIRRGVPRVSKTMLSQRIRELLDHEVIARDGDGYVLTEAGRDLYGVVAALGTWGQTWLSRKIPDDELDLDALVWDMRRRVVPPAQPTVIQIEVSDLKRNAVRYLLLRPTEVSLCAENPGFKASLTLRADRRTLIGWWRGDFSWSEAKRRGLALDGPPALVKAFPTWFQRYLFADVVSR